MAEEAGIYKALWHPEEVSTRASVFGVKASELIEPLFKGLTLLKSDPARFEKFNSPNGWGLYKNFVPFVEEYLKACEEHPEAIVEVSL